MTAQVAADLRAAADVLERDGWCRDAYVSADGSCCAIGALMKVMHPEVSPETDLEEIAAPEYIRIGAAARSLIGVVAPGWQKAAFFDAPVTRWNDDQKSAAEVIATLRAAADRAEAER